MTKRWSLTYEYNWMKGYYFINVNIWRSGKDAVAYLTDRGHQIFPRSNDNSICSIPPHGEVRFGLGFRGINARYMTPKEIDIYQKYGNLTMADQHKQELVAPTEKEIKENEHSKY